jgi:glycerol-3-phosphate dehydrogenase
VLLRVATSILPVRTATRAASAAARSGSPAALFLYDRLGGWSGRSRRCRSHSLRISGKPLSQTGAGLKAKFTTALSTDAQVNDARLVVENANARAMALMFGSGRALP